MMCGQRVWCGHAVVNIIWKVPREMGQPRGIHKWYTLPSIPSIIVIPVSTDDTFGASCVHTCTSAKDSLSGYI